jgi:hypothetical protein
VASHDHSDPTTIAFALLAEKVKVEPSGRLTISGLIHGVERDPRLSDGTEDRSVQFGLCLGFLVGRETHTYRLRVDIRDPDGTVVPYLDGADVKAREATGGGLLQIIQRVEFTPERAGLYWFQVYLDGEVRARIPLRVSDIGSEPTPPPE